jgi:hypothetical protein
MLRLIRTKNKIKNVCARGYGGGDEDMDKETFKKVDSIKISPKYKPCKTTSWHETLDGCVFTVTFNFPTRIAKKPLKMWLIILRIFWNDIIKL